MYEQLGLLKAEHTNPAVYDGTIRRTCITRVQPGTASNMLWLAWMPTACLAKYLAAYLGGYRTYSLLRPSPIFVITIDQVQGLFHSIGFIGFASSIDASSSVISATSKRVHVSRARETVRLAAVRIHKRVFISLARCRFEHSRFPEASIAVFQHRNNPSGEHK